MYKSSLFRGGGCEGELWIMSPIFPTSIEYYFSFFPSNLFQNALGFFLLLLNWSLWTNRKIFTEIWYFQVQFWFELGCLQAQLHTRVRSYGLLSGCVLHVEHRRKSFQLLSTELNLGENVSTLFKEVVFKLVQDSSEIRSGPKL